MPRFIAIVFVFSLFVLFAPVRAQTPPSSAPQPIVYGQTVSCDMTTQHSEAYYIFAAQPGDVITVTMNLVSGNIDPLVILVDESEQTVLAVDNDSGGAPNARLRFVIPAAANYILKATTVQGGANDIKGSYKLMLILGNPTPTPSPLADSPRVAPLPPGGTVQGDLSDDARFRLYSVVLKRGDPLSLSLTIGENPQNMQAGLYVYSSSFGEVGSAEFGKPLDFSAPADGLYFVMVARVSSSGGATYTLSQGGAGDTSGSNIQLSSPVRGKINDDSASNTYSLQGTAGETITARMRRLSGDLVMDLYIASTDTGATIAEAKDDNGVNGVVELTTTLPTTGTYAVVASRDGKQSGTTSGEYTLVVTPPSQPTPVPAAFQGYHAIQYGDKVSGSVDDTAFAAPYVFSAEAGDVIDVTMTAAPGDGLTPYLILQNPNGDTVAEADGTGQPGATLQVTLAQAGYYGIIATRAGLAKGQTSGGFDLSLTALNPAEVSGTPRPADGVALVAGQAQNGSIGNQIGALYRFDAQANTAVSVDVNSSDGLSLVTILADSSFKEIARADSGPIRSQLLTDAGTYYVLVVRRGGPNDQAAGTYNIALQGTVNPVPTSPPGVLAYDQPASGSISKAEYQVRYQLDAKAGTTLLITMDAAPGSSLDPMVALLDASNNLLVVNDDATKTTKNAALLYDVPSDGRYTVLATRSQEAVGTTSGAYILKVSLSQQPTPTPTAPPVTLTAAPTATSSGPQLIPLHYGSLVDGEITAQQFLFYYGFDGKAGDVISIRMTRDPGSVLDSLVYLYRYDSNPPTLLTGNDNSAPDDPDAAIVKFKLPASGPYLIVATRAGAAQGQSVGSFTITLVKDG